MKKLIALLISLLVILPSMVKADVGSPGFSEYKVRVKNIGGTDLYTFNHSQGETILSVKGHLKYDEIIEGIGFEEEYNSEKYIYSDKHDGYVNTSDLEAFGDVDIYKFKNDELLKAYVFKEGAYLYKGPSKLYGKVDKEVMLPVGITIESEYYDDLFVYVTYNGVSGWVYKYQPYEGEGSGPYNEGSCLASISSGDVISIGAEIYKDVKNKEVIGKIPKDKVVKYNYIYDDEYFSTMFYVEYNGVKGWVKDVAVKCNKCTIFTHLKSYDACEKIEYIEEGKDCSKVTVTIPQNTIVPVKYYKKLFDSWYYVEYKGKGGWIYQDHYTETVHFHDNYYNYDDITLKNDTYIYSDIYGEKTDKSIKAGELISFDYWIYDQDEYDSEIAWLYVTSGSNIGWIKINKNDYKDDDLKPSETEENDVVPIDEEIEDDEDDIETKHLSLGSIILLILVGAGLLSLITLIIIKLINKKKDIKPTEEENKVEQ